MSSREIKFRAWDCINLKMLYHMNFVHLVEDGGVYDILDFTDLQESGKWTVMQYTGLRDKNGTDIYEGDVVRWFMGTQKVYWGVGCWKITGGEHGHLLNQLVSRQCEVIGNIYENPELLKT